MEKVVVRTVDGVEFVSEVYNTEEEAQTRAFPAFGAIKTDTNWGDPANGWMNLSPWGGFQEERI